MSIFDKHEYHVIDTSNWKKFKISDLFEIEKGRIESAKKFNPGSIPIVSCSNSNNGIVAYCDTESKWKNRITISANGQPGVAYYHAYDFNATADVDILIEKFEGLNKYIALFLCTIMTKLFTPKYSYTNKLGAAKLKEEIIPLPVTSNGTPDWQYMESYMQNLWDKIEITFKKENNNNRIDTSEWKKFKISDLFEVRNGNYTPLTNLIEDPNGINMISVTNFNNGIVGRYKKIPSMKIYSGKKLTWGKQAPHLFYQKEEFATNQSVYMLDVSNINMMAALFVASVINKIVCPKYDYANNLIGSRMAEEIISLPVTSDGTPDWQYMEDFMRDIESRSVLIQAIKERQNV